MTYNKEVPSINQDTLFWPRVGVQQVISSRRYSFVVLLFSPHMILYVSKEEEKEKLPLTNQVHRVCELSTNSTNRALI